jgi:peptide chain release factor subunit 1
VGEEGKQKKIMTVIEPLKPLVSGLYRCDGKFHLEALYDQLEDSKTFGYMVIDGNGFTCHLLSGNSGKMVYKLDVNLPKKHGRGGQSKKRFERIREIKRGWYTSRIAEVAISHFIDPMTCQPSVAGLVLAGAAQLKDEVLLKLDPRLARIVIAVVDVQYAGVSGFNQAVALTKDNIGNMKFVHEQETITRLMEEISKDGQYAIGIDDTMYAVTSGILDTLILWDNLAVNRIELVKTLSPSDPPKILYLSPDKQVPESLKEEWKVKSTVPLLDWILEHYIEFGCNLELVSDQTDGGAQFVKGFGGLGGLLRYQVELPSNSTIDESASNEEEEYDYDW